MNTNFIHQDERGVAWVAGTNTKVIEIILDYVQDQSPEQIHGEYPHLSLAQIHAAVTYYRQHEQEINALMQQWQERYETEYAKPENQAQRRKIRARGAAHFTPKEVAA